MNKSASIKELATALNKAQAEMPRVSFNSTNPFLKNKYADLGAIIEAARSIIAKNGLSMSQFPFSEGDMIGVTTILMHSSGEWLENSMTIHAGDEKGKSDAQVAGSIITYLRRYAYASVLGMYADEDTDGNKKQTTNGNGHTPDNAPFTVEEACAFLNSQGTPYGQISTDMLVKMVNALSNSKTPKPDDANKITRIEIILKARQSGQLKEPAGLVETATQLGGQPN